MIHFNVTINKSEYYFNQILLSPYKIEMFEKIYDDATFVNALCYEYF